ncbi:hypothetical protein LTC53_14385 [Xanthomonas translucens pv. undulosa]|nr:hypothetical protein LTC53_14385 [Xanthomonas translucens pv. undulosa]WLA03841.1 hypothetical protein MO329_14430 [Xanthomonas translucens]WLA10613.1 hypothetical protein MO328_12745 [Xanthomonas translucens]
MRSTPWPLGRLGARRPRGSDSYAHGGLRVIGCTQSRLHLIQLACGRLCMMSAEGRHRIKKRCIKKRRINLT